MIIHREERYEEDLFITHGKTMNYRMHMNMPHIHDGYELHFALTDNVVIQIEDSSYVVKAGCVTVINNNEIHMTAAPGDVLYERFVLGFRPSHILDICGAYPEVLTPFTKRYNGFSNCLQLSAPQKDELYVMMLEMRSLLEENGIYCAVLKQKLLLVKILLFVAELYAGSDNGRSAKSRPMSRNLSVIIQYINDNLTEPLLLDDLADRFFISKTNLIHMFKQETLLTPNRYIAVRRIMKSREYINDGLPISVVCNLVGYNDQSSFTRVFKQIVGCTPKKYAER
jgi:AraC-like DNA-binding protein